MVIRARVDEIGVTLTCSSQYSNVSQLFFDDCNWGDHVQAVGDAYGVVGQRTPSGVPHLCSGRHPPPPHVDGTPCQWTPPPSKEEKDKTCPPDPQSFSPNKTKFAFFCQVSWHVMGTQHIVFIRRSQLRSRGVSKYFMSSCSCQGMLWLSWVTVACTHTFCTHTQDDKRSKSAKKKVTRVGSTGNTKMQERQTPCLQTTFE